MIRLPILYYLVGRKGPVNAIDLWKVFLRYIPLWVSAYAAANLAGHLTRKGNPFEQLVTCIFFGLSAGVVTVGVSSHQRQTARYLITALRAELVGKVPGLSACESEPSEFHGLRWVNEWIKEQNQGGRLIRTRTLWRCAKNLYRFHSQERFLNFVTAETRVALGIWRRVELPDSVIHRRFSIYQETRTPEGRIIKLPHGSNDFSYDLIKKLRRPSEFKNYQETITSIKQNRLLRNHCPDVYRFRPDGGYVSEYIEGINLARLRDELFKPGLATNSIKRGLVSALEELRQDLACFHSENGHLVGDWPLHNLVFSEAKRAIINVDLEGFFTYQNGEMEAHFPFVESNLCNLIALLNLRERKETEDVKVLEVFRLIDKVRRSGEQYSGESCVTGYHSLVLNDKYFRGQRECAGRLAQVPFDFTQKVVVDLGCNVGGMLHPLSKRIRKGYGFDINQDCIGAAQSISVLNRSPNLDFFQFDLDRQPFSSLRKPLLGETIDICFLLSMCCWLKRWQTVVLESSRISENLLFESNGTEHQQEAQVELLGKCYRQVQLLSPNSWDDLCRSDRKLFLCSQQCSPTTSR